MVCALLLGACIFRLTTEAPNPLGAFAKISMIDKARRTEETLGVFVAGMVAPKSSIDGVSFPVHSNVHTYGRKLARQSNSQLTLANRKPNIAASSGSGSEHALK